MTPRLEVIEIVVSDMQASLAFYRLLGLDIPESDEDHVEADLPGGLRIAWDTQDVIKSFDPDWRSAEGGHRMALAFRVDSPAEVDELFAQLIETGHRGHKEPWDAFWGMRYAQVYDPDENTVDLFAPL